MKKLIDRGLLLGAVALVIVSVVLDRPLVEWPLAPIAGVVVLANLIWFWYRRKELPKSQMEQFVQRGLKNSKK
ncbi:MAG: hypothetical protein ACRCWD_03210 [Culicoidibacterales bacterium]